MCPVVVGDQKRRLGNLRRTTLTNFRRSYLSAFPRTLLRRKRPAVPVAGRAFVVIQRTRGQDKQNFWSEIHVVEETYLKTKICLGDNV